MLRGREVFVVHKWVNPNLLGPMEFRAEFTSTGLIVSLADGLTWDNLDPEYVSNHVREMLTRIRTPVSTPHTE